jgi:hypothetical protein
MTIILDSNANPREVTAWAADEIIALRQRVAELEAYNATRTDEMIAMTRQLFACGVQSRTSDGLCTGASTEKE